MADLDTFVALETKVWEALVAGDPSADRAMLSDTFLGVYPSGFSDRDEHVAQLEGGPSVVTYEIKKAQVRELATGVVLLSYRATYERKGQIAPQAMYVSSIWEQQERGQWINTFSQDTPAELGSRDD